MSNPDDPYVLISASFHRSGSTWLQRVVAAGSDTFVWGETGQLAPGLRKATELWHKRAAIADRELAEFLRTSMAPDVGIANMSPPEKEFLDAQRALFRRLYAERHGRARWGWKAVNYDADDIRHLWVLFPELKVLLLVRDLASVYRSLRALSWQTWWPGGTREIAELWAKRSMSYASLADDPRAMFLKYEDASARISELVRFLGLNPNGNLARAVEARLSTTTQTLLSDEEREDLILGAREALKRLGYPLPA
jgi:hypothetical protein